MQTKYRRPIASCGYWEKVERMAESADRAEIDFIMATECEDDFQIAITRNPIATREDLAWASKTNSLPVMNAVIAHPLTDRVTLFRIFHKLDSYWCEFLKTRLTIDHTPANVSTAFMESVCKAQEALYQRLGDCTGLECSKALRKACKAWFPSTKFSVRQAKDGGFNDLVIRWTDGPSVVQVRMLTRLFVSISTQRLDPIEPLLGPFDRARCYREVSPDTGQ